MFTCHEVMGTDAIILGILMFSFKLFHSHLSPSPSLIAQLVKNRPAMQGILVLFLGLEDLLGK